MIYPIRMLNTNVIKVGGKDSVENVGFLNIRGYMTTVWTLKYWNRGLFFSKYFEEFPVCFGKYGSKSWSDFIHIPATTATDQSAGPRQLLSS